MEYGNPVAPSHGPVLDHNPQRPRPLYDEPTAGVGMGSVLEGEEEHHEKTPVLKKVKDKVRKLKDAITKKRNAHDDVHDVYGEDEDDEDIEVQGAPIYQSRNVQLGTDEYPQGVGGNVPYEHPQGVPLRAGRDISGALGTGRNAPYDHPQGVGRNIPYEPSGALGTGREVPGGRDEHPERERLTLEAIMVMTTLEEDLAPPLPYSSAPLTTGVQTNRPTQAGNTRGDELDVSPDVLSSLETMAISVKGNDQQRDQLAQPALGQASSDVEKKPSYTEKLSSTAAAAKDAAVSVASTVYSTVAGTVAAPKVETMPGGEDKGPSYTEKLSETASAAKDAAVSATSTVYGKVAGAGTALMEKVQQGGGPEPSLTDYLSEKLRPGDDDRALYEVISESMQKRGEEDRVIVEKERVVSTEVTSREGVKGEVVEKERVVPPGVTSREGVKKKGEVSTNESSGGANGGKGVVEKIRETITSIVGGGGGASDASPPPAAVETPHGGGMGRGRGWAREETDY